MHLRILYPRIALCVVSLLMCTASASAQDTGYVSGSVFADIRQFGGTSSRNPLVVDGTSRDATGFGGGVRVGTWVHPRWTLEVGAEVSSKTTNTTRGPVIAIFPPVPPLELKSSAAFTSVTTTIGFHSPAGRRVRLGYRAGFSFVHATYKTEIPGLPALAFLDGTAFASFTDMTGITYLPRLSSLTLSPAALTDTRNSGALTLGFEVAIDLTSKFAVVPELRASTFSSGSAGTGVFLIRPGVGAKWKF